MNMSKKKLRLIFAVAACLLMTAEIIIAFYSKGWVRNYLGDALVVILLYVLYRTVFPDHPAKWFILPTAILLIAFGVEFLQLWGIFRRLGISNRYVLILFGASFSGWDLICYAAGSIPCYLIEYKTKKSR